MKNYFDFQLSPKKLILFYLMIFVFIVLPYIWIVYSFIRKFNSEPEGLIIMIPVIVFMVLAMLALNFFFIKLCIESVAFQGENVQFKGDFSGYLGQILLGLLLTIITLGIYYPWFLRKIYRFFALNSEYKENNFDFLGRGMRLLGIVILTLVIPMIIYSLITKMLGFDMRQENHLNYYIGQFIQTIILIPYLYYYYKWIVDFKYKDFYISLHSGLMPAAGKLLVEILLTMVTLGIYFPLAYLRIYKFFVDHTQATSMIKKYEFGYDIDNLKDFLFLWGQILLTVITLGIYLPWSTVKIYKRVINKTYRQELPEEVTAA